MKIYAVLYDNKVIKYFPNEEFALKFFNHIMDLGCKLNYFLRNFYPERLAIHAYSVEEELNLNTRLSAIGHACAGRRSITFESDMPCTL
jgi:hypothetical protein